MTKRLKTEGKASLRSVVEEIISDGQLTIKDQCHVNNLARFTVLKDDLEAVNVLTEKISSGEVKVI